MWPTGGWGSIEYGSAVPGQVVGGRWKPLHYQFRKSTFADQMSTCNTGGACFVTNDSPFAFSGSVSARVINVVTAGAVAMFDVNVSLGPGAGVTHWFCGTGTAGAPLIRDKAASVKTSAYNNHPRQIPVDRDNFTRAITSTNEANCETACNKDTTCIGFTATGYPVSDCWLYASAPKLMDYAAADWYQKPGTPPIPAPPAPPPPPPTPAAKSPPPMLNCVPWAKFSPFQEAQCTSNGSNCVLEILVKGSGGAVMSTNVLPFQPPVAMALPPAHVQFTIGQVPMGSLSVPIEVTASAAALFVVLSTQAQGRFSDNFFLVEPSVPTKVTFIPWSPLDSATYNSLKTTLRVEHLAENV